MNKKKAIKVIKQAWTVKDIISNILWFLLGGLWLGILFGFFGVILCATVVGLPLGVQCFRVALVTMFPYGKRVELHPKRNKVANIVWAVLFGWELAVVFLAAGLLCCMTVVSFFRGLQAFKLCRLAFVPFGAEISKANI